MPERSILMYHRICARTRETEPYFARGTAVEPQIFHSQLAWLSQNCDIVPFSSPFDAAASKPPRPQVVLTFDDGYLDAKRHVEPACASLGVPWTLFVGPWCGADPATLLWVDEYYALLARAGRDRRVDLAWLLDSAEIIAPSTDDLQWWVRGSPKQVLAAMNAGDRAVALQRLAHVLDVELDHATAARALYCSPSQLGELIDAGVTLGGHGETHARLGDLAKFNQVAEIAASKTFLDDLKAPEPRCFAYPDGSFSAAVAAQVRAAGFTFAVTVEPGAANAESDSLRLPRHIVRNLTPPDPRWCAAFAATGMLSCQS